MKTRLMMIASALMASLLCLPAFAQPGPGMGSMGSMGGMGGMGPNTMQGTGPGPGPRIQRDCSQTPNPGACAAHREFRAKAMQACEAKAGPEHRQCMHEQYQNFDCGKAANPQQCEGRKQAYQACQGQQGPAFRQCVQQKMPPVDCSKSADPARCDVHQKAREACKDKLGPEHKACLYQQFNVK